MPFNVGDLLSAGGANDIYRVDEVHEQIGGGHEYRVTWMSHGIPQRIVGRHTMAGFDIYRPPPDQTCKHIAWPHCVCVANPGI